MSGRETMDEQWSRAPRYWDARPGTGPWEQAGGADSGAGPGSRAGSGPTAWTPSSPSARPYPRFEPPAAPGAPRVPGPPPCGPPARVGSAVAALVGAVLTLAFPIVFLVIGEPLLFLLMNIPGIVFGVMGLTKTADPAEVERHIGYTWACTLTYIALVVIIVSLMFAPVGTA
ncbi:hypothetical protein [Nocardiopsis rhodophaea]|uniref:hypothetical protein n=1 Tax=Nocardiopsis rhodophaea TaxID=280238 RepID=UPI0031D56C63